MELELEVCPECGAPELLTSENLWLDNGDIIQKRVERNRMIFIETENLDPVFQSIEQIIGTSIEQVVITAMRRAVRGFLGSFLPDDLLALVRSRELDYRPAAELFIDVAAFYGYGRYELVDELVNLDENDFFLYRINDPSCLPMAIGTMVATVEALSGMEQGYSYEEKSSGIYEIKVSPAPHPEGLKERMHSEVYRHQEGGLQLERCPSCGGPSALSEFRWVKDKGIIKNTTTGRRMAFMGDLELDPVFQELEVELGETVPRAVVEAQRRFTRSGFYTTADLTDASGYRNQLALRGLGNLKELEMKRKGMRMCMDNVVLPLIVTGQAQGFFEMGFDTDSTVDWELTDERRLCVEVKPRA
jgi:hypothetical protein